MSVKATKPRSCVRTSAAPSARAAGGVHTHTSRRPPPPTPEKIAKSLDFYATLGPKNQPDS